jgi:hypothetical protein
MEITMILATTDRTGPDNSPLTLKVEVGMPVHQSYPALGTLVCAHGKHGWNYIGAVTAVNESAGTYTILPVAIDRASEKTKAWKTG